MEGKNAWSISITNYFDQSQCSVCKCGNRGDFPKWNKVKTGSKTWRCKSRKAGILNKTAGTFLSYDPGGDHLSRIAWKCVCSGSFFCASRSSPDRCRRSRFAKGTEKCSITRNHSDIILLQLSIWRVGPKEDCHEKIRVTGTWNVGNVICGRKNLCTFGSTFNGIDQFYLKKNGAEPGRGRRTGIRRRNPYAAWSRKWAGSHQKRGTADDTECLSTGWHFHRTDLYTPNGYGLSGNGRYDRGLGKNHLWEPTLFLSGLWGNQRWDHWYPGCERFFSEQR